MVAQAKATARARPELTVVPPLAVVPDPAPVEAAPAAEVPKPGVLLRSYRLTLRSIDTTSTLVGGTAISSMRLMGLPKGPTQKMKKGQAAALHGVIGWSDDVGTKWAHGVGHSKVLAKKGARMAAKGWVREMKFFITLH
jgi:hypothetical protein